jgi:hypothetical protein
MSLFSRIGEAMIDEAIASGELTPPPPGTKLDLEAYFQTPEAWRAAHSMLKGHGFAPPEVEQLKQIGEMEAKLESSADPEERQRLQRRIGELRASFQLAMERVRASGGI